MTRNIIIVVYLLLSIGRKAYISLLVLFRIPDTISKEYLSTDMPENWKDTTPFHSDDLGRRIYTSTIHIHSM